MRSTACVVLCLAGSAVAQTTWFVDLAAPAPGQGSATQPFASLKHALQQPAIVSGDTVLVAPGVYLERIDFHGKDVVVRSLAGPDQTILDGQDSGTIVRFEHGESAAARLEGFTLRDGAGLKGGGIRCIGSSPTVVDCRILHCVAFSRGGGVYVLNGSPSFERCLFATNGAASGGGFSADNAPTFRLARCTFTLNSGTMGSGVLLENGSNGLVTDCIVWGNLGNPGSYDFGVLQSAPTVRYCDIEGAPAGVGVFDADPMFVATLPGSGLLSAGSRCIDAADPALPLDPDLTRADLGCFPYFQGCANTLVYCSAGLSSGGCAGSISSSGAPSFGAGSGFVLRVSGIDALRQGLIFYGASGRTALPWGTTGSLLCVEPPTQRTPLQSSGGNFSFCNGALQLDWNAFVAAHPGSLGSPFTTGTHFFAQGWYRDPPSSKGTQMSDALEFVGCP